MNQASSGVGVGVPAPPVLYVPVVLTEAGEVSEVRMLKLDDGRIALVGYTALDRFVDAWGGLQPWAVMATTDLEALQETKPYDLKILDVPIPMEARDRLGGLA